MMLILLAACAALTVLMFSVGIMLNNGQRASVGNFANLTVKERNADRKRSMEQSFTVRVIYPLAQRLFHKTEELLPIGGKSWVRQNLIRAGLRKPNYPAIFIGGQLLLALVMPLYLIFMGLILFRVPFSIALYLGILGSIFGLVLPVFWLTQAVKARKTKIWRALPDFLDLLVISVEAGLGLDISIHKITENDIGKRAKDLREELLLYLQDLNLGKPRATALQDMADRVGLDDLNMLNQALIQSFEMGNSLAHTLRVQSEIMRTKRIQIAEEKAAKIPVKMVPPIYFFLFPAIFVSILGPLAMLAIEALDTILKGTGDLH
jgi:tight adherence protein C